MFGKSKDNQPSETPQDQTPVLPELISPQPQEVEEMPEVVKTVEKVSGIITPYFIALVGLALYDRNFLIGIILITVGLVSLLKISPQKINNFVEEIKKLF